MSKGCIGVIYEMTNNPFFSGTEQHFNDRLSEFVRPSEVDAICKALKTLGFSVEVIDGPQDLLNRATQIKEKCIALFNKSIGFKGLERKILVPAIAQLFELPLIGSSAYPMTLCRHKFHTNRLLSGLGFRVPEAYLIEEKNEAVNLLPTMTDYFIVKPNYESDSLGISESSIQNNNSGILSKIKELKDAFHQDVIIEQYIPGEEWKVAVIGNHNSTEVIGLCGVMKNGKPITNSLQTRNDLVKGKLNYYKPDNLKLVKQAQDIAMEIHKSLGLFDYSRVDFRLGKNDELYCMEVSTHPLLSESGSFVQSSSLSHCEIINRIVEAGQERFQLNRSRTGT